MRQFQKTLPPRPGFQSLSMRPTLRIDRRAAAYARQSDPHAKKKKSESKEMQTVDIMNWCKEQGWRENLLDPYYADIGLSGTLRPDQRPDMLRLFDNMDKGLYDSGSVICFQESRLFRDDTQIYYNQFIDKCKSHDVVVVVVSPYLMIYDFQDEFLTEMFRWKCKEAADFIKRHIKGWLHPARERAAWVDGEWAGMGDIPIGYIVDFDEHSQTYKKFIPYEPHRKVVCWIFRRFRELGGNISLLYQEVGRMSLVLPFFEEWVDPRNISKFSKVSQCPGGYIIKNRTIITNILTNPMYIGYRAVRGVIRRNSNGEKIKDHDPLVDRELFDFAYYRLAKTDLDGNLLNNGRKTHRYFHRGNDGEYGLLKFRIRWSGGQVHTRPVGEYDEDNPTNKAVYKLNPGEKENPLASHSYVEIDCEELDALVVERLFAHVHELYQRQEQLDRYNETARQVREERQTKLAQVMQSIGDTENAQANLTKRLGTANERMYELLEAEINRLEEERLQLLHAKEELEREAANDLGRLEDELMKLKEKWPDYPFARRRTLLNFLIKDVVVDAVSTHWIRVQVLWLHETWGWEQMYFQRRKGKNSPWTEEETELLITHYPTTPKWEVMRLLPDRGWYGICGQAKLLGIERVKGRIPIEQREAVTECLMPFLNDKVSSYSDLVFLYEQGLEPTVSKTRWVRLSQTA